MRAIGNGRWIGVRTVAVAVLAVLASAACSEAGEDVADAIDVPFDVVVPEDPNDVALRFENTSKSTLTFLFPKGTPPFLVEEKPGARIELRANFSCPLRHVHSCFHAQQVEIAPGQTREIRCGNLGRHTIKQISGARSTGGILHTFKSAAHCVCAETHCASGPHTADTGFCRTCGIVSTSSCCRAFCCRNDDDGNCLHCGKPIEPTALQALRDLRWTTRFRVGDTWKYEWFEDGERAGEIVATLGAKRSEPPTWPKSIAGRVAGEWIRMDVRREDHRVAGEPFVYESTEYWHWSKERLVVVDPAANLITDVDLKKLAAGGEFHVVLASRGGRGNVRKGKARVGDKDVECTIVRFEDDDGHAEAAFHPEFGIVVLHSSTEGVGRKVALVSRTGTTADWKVLFPGETWNDFPASEVRAFRGVVNLVPDDDLPDYVQRYNPYKLELDTGETLDIYCGSSDVLKKYVGKHVVIEGKRTQIGVEGHLFDEIWPTRIRPRR